MPEQLDKFRVTCFFDMPYSVQAQMVWHVHQEGISTTTDADFMDACKDQLKLGWWDNIKASLDAEVIFDRIQFDEVNAAGEITRFVGWRTVGDNGTGGSEMLPHMDALLQTLNTQVPGVRGRKYTPGMVEGDQNNGLAGSTTVSRLAASLGEILAGFVVNPATQWYFGVISQKVGDFVTFSNTGKVTNLLATQRRRRIGRGS